MRIDKKALGLALVAALALSAVAASAAQAENATFTADNYPALIKGSQEGETNFFESTNGRRTECKVADYQATLAEEASHELTVTPHYDECEADGQNAVIDRNGCHFVFKTAGTEETGTTPGTADLVCPTETKSITITVIVFGSVVCEVHVPEQKGLTGVTFHNKGGNTVTVTADITDQITYIDTDTSPFVCPFIGTTEGHNGDFVSNVTVEGFKDEGEMAHPTTEDEHSVTYEKGAKTNIDVG